MEVNYALFRFSWTASCWMPKTLQSNLHCARLNYLTANRATRAESRAENGRLCDPQAAIAKAYPDWPTFRMTQPGNVSADIAYPLCIEHRHLIFSWSWSLPCSRWWGVVSLGLTGGLDVKYHTTRIPGYLVFYVWYQTAVILFFLLSNIMFCASQPDASDLIRSYWNEAKKCIDHRSVLNAFNRSKALTVPGIGGQDGSYLCEILLQNEYTVHGILRPRTTNDYIPIAVSSVLAAAKENRMFDRGMGCLLSLPFH